MKHQRYSSAVNVALLFLVFAGLPAAAQIQVDSASPSAAPQGTVNLDVVITGNGFKKGATAQWFVTGTTNPGGVTVNSTTYKGATQLTANITVAPDAVISGFDIVVTNADRRTGKGTDKFAVTLKGTPIGCTTTGTPSGFSLATVLNPVQPNGAALITTGTLGNAISVRPIDLNRDSVVDTLLAFVVSGGYQTGVTYLFLLDPVTGKLQATNPVSGVAWQNPITLLTGLRGTQAEAGDVNGDGVPDFLIANTDTTAYLFVGSLSGPPAYTVSYTSYPIAHPASAPGYWQIAAAMGDLDGDGLDEIVLGARPAKGDKTPPGVYIFKYSAGAVNFVRQINDPTGVLGSQFGSAIAIGNVDGNPGNELVVGAKTGGANGLVYVFPYPAQQSNYFTFAGTTPNFGTAVGVADVNMDGAPDLIVVNASQALIYPGYVHAGESFTNQLNGASGLTDLWAYPNSDMGQVLTSGAVAVGAPNATLDKNCQGGVGAVHLFTSPFASSQYPNSVFEPPDLVGGSGAQYGFGVAIVPGYPFVIIGEHFRPVGTTAGAGQVYVYKAN